MNQGEQTQQNIRTDAMNTMQGAPHVLIDNQIDQIESQLEMLSKSSYVQKSQRPKSVG